MDGNGQARAQSRAAPCSLLALKGLRICLEPRIPRSNTSTGKTGPFLAGALGTPALELPPGGGAGKRLAGTLRMKSARTHARTQGGEMGLHCTTLLNVLERKIK